MKEPIRVLNVTRVFQAAGIESFIMNVYRNIDRSKIQFDFLIMRNENSIYAEEILSLGGRIYAIDVNEKNSYLRILRESKELHEFLKNHYYQIIHIHYTTPLRAPYLLAAKKAKIPIRIYHSHSAEISGKSRFKLLVYKLYRGKIACWATDYFACSEEAANWMYPEQMKNKEKVKIIYNGIDINRFSFNKDKRKLVRYALKISDEYVLIHTGRFIDQKNQKFIVSIFFELKRKYTNVKLLLLGEGELLEEIKTLVRKLGLENDVIFLGIKTNVEDYLCAADCYIMPSLYEGLPVAAIEAECTGLPCVFSKEITREVALTENIVFLSLDQPISDWVNSVLNYKDVSRHDCSRIIQQQGYDIKDVAYTLQQFYETALTNR